MGNSKHVDLANIETSGIDNFNERVFSLNKKSNVFEIKNWQFLGQTKQRFFFCLKISYTKRKKEWYLKIIENFWYHNTTLSYSNPILIYNVWIAKAV